MTTHRCGCIDLSPIHTSHTYINRNCTYARHVSHFGASQFREYACVLFFTPDLLQLHPSLVPKVDDSPDCFFTMSCQGDMQLPLLLSAWQGHRLMVRDPSFAPFWKSVAPVYLFYNYKPSNVKIQKKTRINTASAAHINDPLGCNSWRVPATENSKSTEMRHC